jgi:hypothetical protein
MIGKVTRGTNVAQLLRYLYGPGKANEHTDQHLVAGFGDPAELEPERRPNGSRDLRRLAALLNQPLAALNGSNYDKPVWHCSLRTAPGDPLLSDAEWAQIAAHVMHRTGLAPDGDDLGVRWVAVRHAPDHIHLVVTLARQDCHRPKTWNDFLKVRQACQESERRFGLQATAPADRTASRRATRAETEQTTRRGWSEPPRDTLRREVCTAAAGARTEQEFFTRLADAGVRIRYRHSTTHPTDVTGYAVSLPHHTTKDGDPIWYSGGKLAADLTLPKLRTRWPDPQLHDPLVGAEHLSPTAVRAVLRTTVMEAAHRSTGEADFFAQLRACGLLVRERYSELTPGEITGYSVTLPGHTAPDGTPCWYGGGRLHPSLTLPRLRNAWSDQTGTSQPGATPRFTPPERSEAYRYATRQTAAAAEHLRHCADHDPDLGADAAWAAADTLHAAARAFQSPLLRCAAANYDRAARERHGHIPRRTREGDQLRTAARLLAMSGPGIPAQIGALILNLMALMEAVAELRAAQNHTAQADAARQAAQQFHDPVADARRREARRGPVRTRHAWPQSPTTRDQTDFPIPISESLQTAPADMPGARSRVHAGQQSARAGQSR